VPVSPFPKNRSSTPAFTAGTDKSTFISDNWRDCRRSFKDIFNRRGEGQEKRGAVMPEALMESLEEPEHHGF
jgi:hypothetical protein